MYHKKETEKGSVTKKENFDNSANRSEGHTVVNTNRVASVFDQSSRIDKSYGALYIDNFARSSLNPVL